VGTFLRRIPPEPTCFLLVAATWATYLLVAGDDRFYYDAASYWQLGELFGQNAHFSLLAYDHPYRGYSLPLWNHGLDIVASVVEIGESTIVQLTGSLLVATLGVMVVPRLARALFSEAAVSWGRVLALNGRLFLFWRDHIGFPLSDFPALLAACVGVLGLLRATKAGYLVAGLSFGLAVNLRPAYLLAAVGAVVFATLVSRGPWKSLAHIFAPAFVLTGALVVSLPQMAINHHHRGSWSPKAREVSARGSRLLHESPLHTASLSATIAPISQPDELGHARGTAPNRPRSSEQPALRQLADRH